VTVAYPLDQLRAEMAFIAYHLHWGIDDICRLSHQERVEWVGERIHVLVVPRSGTAPTVAALRQHLAGRLEKFKHPDAWHVAAALPLGRTGKADRGALGALIAAGQTVPLPP